MQNCVLIKHTYPTLVQQHYFVHDFYSFLLLLLFLKLQAGVWATRSFFWSFSIFLHWYMNANLNLNLMTTKSVTVANWYTHTASTSFLFVPNCILQMTGQWRQQHWVRFFLSWFMKQNEGRSGGYLLNYTAKLKLFQHIFKPSLCPFHHLEATEFSVPDFHAHRYEFSPQYIYTNRK